MAMAVSWGTNPLILQSAVVVACKQFQDDDRFGGSRSGLLSLGPPPDEPPPVPPGSGDEYGLFTTMTIGQPAVVRVQARTLTAPCSAGLPLQKRRTSSSVNSTVVGFETLAIVMVNASGFKWQLKCAPLRIVHHGDLWGSVGSREIPHQLWAPDFLVP